MIFMAPVWTDIQMSNTHNLNMIIKFFTHLKQNITHPGGQEGVWYNTGGCCWISAVSFTNMVIEDHGIDKVLHPEFIW